MTTKLNNIAKEMAVRAIELAERQVVQDIINYFNAQDQEDVAREIEKGWLRKVKI